MASFTPTLRIVLTQNILTAAGRELDEFTVTLRKAFVPISIRDNVEFKADYVQSIETSEVVKDFTALIVGRFTAVGLPHLILATGDVVELTVELL